MKKACILTLYGNNNFGNKLQNYAVQEKLKENNLEVKTLKNYNSKYKFKNLVINKIFNRFKIFVKEIILHKKYKNENFKRFDQKYLKNDSKIYFSNENNINLCNKYDYFFVGSDQVWNPDFGLKGDLKFLEFSNKEKNISFSASIGVEIIPDTEKESYKKGISNIKYISLREETGKKIVEELTNRKDAIVLLDPTMLLAKEKWQKISKKPDNLKNEKYILNYFLGNLSDERKNKINKLAEKNGLKVINILNPNDPFYRSGPSEFIYLEEHAELICTDSFHSCVFAILMNTPFMVFNREEKGSSMNSRLETLLSKFKLEDRYYKGELDDSHLICDYSHCEQILEEERKKADDFLKKALDIE